MPRHILHLARLYVPHRGGVETHVAALTKIELTQGDKVTIITNQDNPGLPTSEVSGDLMIKRIPFEALESKLKTWNWIRQQPDFKIADIVQVHDVFWWIWPVYFSIRSKIFITFHGWEGVYPVRWQAKLQRYVANKLSRGVMHIGAWIQEFYWDKPTVITYGGVDGAALRVTSPSGDPVSRKLVFIGRLETANEIELYIQLFTQLKSQLPELEIEWIGDGPFRSPAEQVGFVTGMVADPWSRAATATLIASNSYLSILNAQALGKVVVGLYSQPLKQRYLETYPGKQWMMIGNSPEKVTQKILTLIHDPQLLESQATAAQAFARTQTWGKVAEVYEKMWAKNKV